MNDTKRMIFIHGLAGSSRGVKATLLKGLFPGVLTPDFRGSLEERMGQLEVILRETANWTIIGSSFGGLMGALFTCQNPNRVKKLVLLAPALVWGDFVKGEMDPVSIPTIIFHGVKDEIIPLESVRDVAGKVFRNLTFHAVEDDHGLYRTVHQIDWEALVGD